MSIALEPGWVSVKRVPEIDALADRVGIQYGRIDDVLTSPAKKNKDGGKEASETSVTRSRIVLFREHARINLDGEQLMIVRRSDIIGEYLAEGKAK